MGVWRKVMADGYSGGLLGVLLALSFAVQMMAAGRAAAAPEPLHVICTSSPDGAHRTDGPIHEQECPCSQLCGAGLHPQNALAPSDGSGLAIRFADRVEIVVERRAATSGGAVLRQGHARGPPRISI